MPEQANRVWDHVEKTLARLKKLSEQKVALCRELQIDTESPLAISFFEAEGMLIDSLELLVNDEYDTISWFCSECKYGDTPQEAGKGEYRLIDSVENLRWLIDQQRNFYFWNE